MRFIFLLSIVIITRLTSAQNAEYMSISGYCMDRNTGEPVIADIILESTADTVLFDTSDVNGYFHFDSLPKSEINYRIKVHAVNFYSEKAKCSDDTILFFKMEPTPVCVMPFPIFYFEENSLNFCEDFEEVLNAMTSILNDNPNLQMEIIAYTDSLENKKLRKKRAKKVYKVLVKNDVSKDQLVFSDNQRENSLFILNEDSSNFVEIFPTESYIQSQPTEKQEELRALNRRVMFSIISTDLEPKKKKK